MENLNRLCHSLGSLEAQIIALNDNLHDLRDSLTSISIRVAALENKYAFWNGKIVGIIAISGMIAYVANLIVHFI